MVNCKGVSSSPKSPVNKEICRYCRTRVCEECFVAATSRSSTLQSTPARHQHVCLVCSRLHPEAKKLRSPPRERRQSRFQRVNSAPSSVGPRIDSLANMAREHSGRIRSDKPSVEFLSAEYQPQQQARSPKKSRKPAEMELSTVDLRRRRRTSAIAPSRPVDFPCPSRPSRARQLLKANATELQAARRHQNATQLHTSTSYSCDFTRTTARMAIRDATSTVELAMMAGSKPLFDMSDEPNELRLSTVDLRLPKYQVNVPVPTSIKRGRRASAADPANSALTPISIENLAAIDAKLSSVELELKRYDVSPMEHLKQPKGLATGGSNSSEKTEKHSAEPIDFHLSTLDLRPRPRRRTTTNALTLKSKVLQHGNQEAAVEEVEIQVYGGLAPFQRKKDAEPVDFHLSTFDLKPRKHATEVGRHESRSNKEKKEKRKKEQSTPKYSKDELCDLAYLQNFRSYTL
ncbi:Zinc finger, FYVE/PHD-type [Phytophthora cactorum]|nr:Zinc finger, FYVE/PHD-type [Phytophthora cactorum]KAF1788914.1 Zinc finger, FYVE/PHD-type [Phytophthora cactorum]